MTKSRRQFLKTGTLAALFAAVPLKGMGSTKWKGWAASLGEALLPSDDPLANYSKATFLSYVESVFEIQTQYGALEVTLVSVRDMPAATGGECFSLLFRGGGTELKQNTYEVQHAALGTFQLFLVPGGADQTGTQQYVATINRLSLAESTPAPSPSPTP
jgi:hypothetical protein